MNEKLLTTLEVSQNKLLALMSALPTEDCYKQYHYDLSPLAWHLGHCAFIEAYWIREVVLEDNTLTESLRIFISPG